MASTRAAIDCTAMTSSRRIEALSDTALLGKLVGARSSRRLFKGSFSALLSEHSDNTPEIFHVAREFVRRYLSEQLHRQCVLSQPSAVRELLKLHFAGQEYESFVCFFLDAQNRLIAAEELFRGTLTQTSVYPREIIKIALRFNAAALIVAHNHPSGVAEPSIQDQALTRTLADTLHLVDVKLLDHFVIAGANALSFAERGLI
jgi:DNA repair protein RadC